MLFHEVYCAYFNAVAAIIKAAQTGEVDERQALQIIHKQAFSESMLAILPAIKNEDWLVLTKGFHTPIKHPPEMALTTLQKRWLKALLTDPRIALFDVDASGLSDVEPLFCYDDFVFFDRYADGDPYTDEGYIACFKTLLQALKTKQRVRIRYLNRQGRAVHRQYVPYQLEYSAKDDKFRLEAISGRHSAYINLARIQTCAILGPYSDNEVCLPQRNICKVAFTLRNERNALDRVMLHFSDCRKETKRLQNGLYQIMLWYEAQNETEMLIRILSFGPVLRVTAPDSFIRRIRERLEMQRNVQNYPHAALSE